MKKVLLVLLVLILLAAIAALYLVSSLDGRVKDTIEENTSRLTESPVEIESVDFSIFTGEGTITGLRVSNPPGFSDNPALILGQIYVRLDMDNLSMDLVPVKLIQADSISIRVEKNGEGKINFQELSANLKNNRKGSASEESDFSGWKPKLKIDRFLLSEGEVALDGFSSESRNLKTPEFVLENLGGPEGAPPEIVGEEILSRIFSQVIKSSVQSGVERWLEKNTNLPDPVKDLINQGLEAIN